MIWGFRGIPQRGFPRFVDGERVGGENEVTQPDLFSYVICPYCETSFTRFSDSRLGDIFGGDGRETFFKEVEICKGCGWWRATRYEDRTTPSFREEDIYRGWGSLMELDLPDLALPVDDLRNAVKRHIDAYGSIGPSIWEANIADIFRYAGFARTPGEPRRRSWTRPW